MPVKLKKDMKFGNWTVIERDYNPTSKQHSTFWFCRCELCGNIYSVSRDSLVKGLSSCCNHCKGEKISQTLMEKEITSYKIGDKYGLLTIIGRGAMNKKHTYVKCKCDCGTELEVRLEHLKGQNSKGRTISCGCASESSGEIKIRQILEKYNVNFQNQYRIRDFNISAPFDFALFDDDNKLLGLLEFDGEQHFYSVDYFGGEEKFNLQRERDERKNRWCRENNIRLARIPYTDYDKITIEYLISYFPEISCSETEN